MAQGDTINKIVDRVNDFNRRVRNLEEKIRNLNARVQTLDDTILEKTDELNSNMQEINDEISEIRDRIANMEVDIKEINKEKRKFVSQQQIEEMESYMDLMNPLQAGFITKSEAKDMMDSREGLSEEEVKQIVDRKIKNLQDKESKKETGERQP